MNLSAAIIHEYLKDMGYESEVLGKNFSVKFHKYFFSSEQPDPDHLYFLSANFAVDSLPEKGNFVVSDDFLSIDSMAGKNRNVLIIHTCDSRAFHLLENCFIDYYKWEQDIEQAILFHVTLPQILNKCEERLNNPIVLTDSSFRVLASSEDESVSDMEWLFIKKHGYHSTQFINTCLEDEKFQRCMQKPEIFPYHINDIRVIPPSNANNNLLYSSIQVPITLEGQLVAFLSTIIKDSISQWLIDLSVEIAKAIRGVFSDGKNLLSPNILENNAIKNFLLGKTDNHVAQSILSKALSYSNGNSLYLVSFHLKEAAGFEGLMILSALVDSLADKKLLNCCYTVRMDTAISIIVNESKNKSKPFSLFGISNEYLRKNQIYAAISLNTNTVDDLPALYQQTLFLLENTDAVFPKQHKLLYEYHIMEDLVSRIHSPSVLNAMVHPLLKQLRQDEKNADLYETICAYVLSFFDSDATARNIHVHRNTVYYRLKKVEEIGEVELKDSVLRMQLIISVSILRRYPAL